MLYSNFKAWGGFSKYMQCMLIHIPHGKDILKTFGRK